MSVGKVLLGVGLGLDVVATLFISLDAFRSQRQTAKIYEILAFITGLEMADRRTQPAKEKADELSKQARSAVQPDAPEEMKEIKSKLEKYDQMDVMLTIAKEVADQKNREILQGQLDKVASEFDSRKYLIKAAIAAVFVGGALEFIGGVVLGA